MYSKREAGKTVNYTGFTLSSSFALGVLTILLVWVGIAPSGLIGIIRSLVSVLS
jgi:hypothetical protein